MNYIDLLIVAVLLFALARGYFSGLLSSVASIAAYGVGIVVAVIYYGAFKDWLNQSYQVVDRIANGVEPLLPIPQPVFNASLDGVAGEDLLAVANQLSLPETYKNLLLVNLEHNQLVGAGQASVGELVTNVVANTIAEVMAFTFLFMAAFTVVKRLGKFITRRVDRTGFNPINRMAGSALGLVVGALGLTLAFGLLLPLLTVGGLAHFQSFMLVSAEVEQSVLTPYLLETFIAIQGSLGGVLPFTGEVGRVF
ncbi:putative membrane protein required for colicin V production [Desulfitispora alkaliphila]|uniref:CvpA family protein n=1 Tax=Desulfitispora alkaliphila TaxID=622674 RepID=UPI003D1CB814